MALLAKAPTNPEKLEQEPTLADKVEFVLKLYHEAHPDKLRPKEEKGMILYEHKAMEWCWAHMIAEPPTDFTARLLESPLCDEALASYVYDCTKRLFECGDDPKKLATLPKRPERIDLPEKAQSSGSEFNQLTFDFAKEE